MNKSVEPVEWCGMGTSWAECYEVPGADLFAKVHAFAVHCRRHRHSGLTCFRRPLQSPNSPQSIMVDAAGRSRPFIMLGSNSYLNLTADPRVIEAARAAASKYGYGMGSVSLFAGTTDLHLELEQRLAEWYRCEAALLFPTGYAANVGTISALLRPGDAAVNDLFNHASIYDGCRLSGATLHTFAHKNMRRLERVLKTGNGTAAAGGNGDGAAPEDQRAAGGSSSATNAAPNGAHGTLIITDGVFSMDGDIAPLDQIVALARQHGARVMLDEAHAMGVIGPNGRGTAELYGLEGQLDVTMTTLSKCLGGIGGCVAGSAALIEYLRFYSRSYFFSAAIPAPVVAGALAALDILVNEPQRRQDLWTSIHYMKTNLEALGFETGQTQSAIIPIVIGAEDKLQAVLLELMEAGIFMNYVCFPAVPKQRSRLRMSLMSGMSRADLDYTLETLQRVGRKHGVIG